MCDVSEANRLCTLLKNLVAEWPERRIHLALERMPEKFTCAPDMLRIALRNLLTNADRHATPGTAITLVAEGCADGHVCTSVTNIGKPIPTEEVPQLFHMYFRGRTTHGTLSAGLGLFIVQQIVNAHGGVIRTGTAALACAT